MTTSRTRKSEVGYLGLNEINGRIYESIRTELRYPDNLNTYKKMSLEPTINASNNILNIMVSRVPWEFKVGDNATERGRNAADFLNYCMKNLDDGHTWKSTIEEFGSYRIYGYHVAEKVFTKVVDGEYKGKLKWKKLPTRSQDTLTEWKFDTSQRKLLGVYQSLIMNGSINGSGLLNDRELSNSGDIYIPREKMMHFVYGRRRENPEGESPLNGCFIPWKYKSIIDEYEAVGVARDMGGTPVIKIPVDTILKATEDPTGPEAQLIEDFKTQAELLHAGEATTIMVPMRYTEDGKPLYGFELVGITGGGKQYNTDDIIKRKQNEIFWIYLTDGLKLGSEGHGSFALSENKTGMLAYGVEHHLELITDVVNSDLIPQTLEINGWGDLEGEDIPQLTYGDLDELDLDDFSKFLQRVASVGLLPRDPEFVNEILERAGLDYRLPDDLKLGSTEYDNLFTSAESRAADGMKTAGQGTSTNSNSDVDNLNKENA